MAIGFIFSEDAQRLYGSNTALIENRDSTISVVKYTGKIDLTEFELYKAVHDNFQKAHNYLVKHPNLDSLLKRISEQFTSRVEDYPQIKGEKIVAVAKKFEILTIGQGQRKINPDNDFPYLA